MRIISKVTVCTFVLFSLNSVTPSLANASDHIKVTKEIFIKTDSPVDPLAIIKTQDGGYVVSGYSGLAWATRINADGEVKWQYTHSNKKQNSKINSAAMLPDDSVILCGEAQEQRKDGLYIQGLITHLSKDEKIISERSMLPNDGNKIHTPSALDQCFSTEYGAVILGSATGATWGENPSFWYISLDNSGSVKYEKLSPDLGNRNILIMPDKSFVTHSNEVLDGYFFANRMSHVDLNGTVRSSRVVPNFSFPVTPINNNNEIQIITNDGNGNNFLVVLNESPRL